MKPLVVHSQFQISFKRFSANFKAIRYMFSHASFDSYYNKNTNQLLFSLRNMNTYLLYFIFLAHFSRDMFFGLWSSRSFDKPAFMTLSNTTRFYKSTILASISTLPTQHLWDSPIWEFLLVALTRLYGCFGSNE